MHMSVKKVLKKIPFLHTLGRFAKARVIDAKGIRCLLAERRVKHRPAPIRVGFLCQYIPAWTKLQDLYHAMLDDPRFEPVLLCIPSEVPDPKSPPSGQDNDIYDYCLNNGYPEAINTVCQDHTWLDLKALDLHYVFYPRPYNALVPSCYTTDKVSRYARVCLIMYGLEFSEDMTEVSLNRNFMANTYYYFAELPFMREVNIRRNSLGHRLKLQKTECHGYPMFAHLMKYKNEASVSWDFSKNGFRILWTPRWTTSLAAGGTNFFTYYKELLDFAETHTDMDFLFRPHPLALSNFVKTGEMTQEEADAFRNRCAALPNVSLDAAPNYEATLWGTSVMVSDISSIMPEYFLTGNPLVFCASNMHLKLASTTLQMLEGCYIVNNATELFSVLSDLRRGVDPLKEKRLKIVKEQYGEDIESATANILNALAQDHAPQGSG